MLQKLITEFRAKELQITAWLDEQKKLVGSDPIYASVDVRNAGFKLAPVDTNLFPAGWNNLCPSYAKKAGVLFRQYFDRHFPETNCLLILPELHTRNLFYLSNVYRLQQILMEAGFVVKVGSLNPEIKGVMEIQTSENETLALHEVKREGDNLVVDDHRVCQVIVNNDFSDGIPEILRGIKQNLLPTPEIGWHRRKKSEHFTEYERLATEFANMLGIDPWHFLCRFEHESNVDFADAESRERVAEKVDSLLLEIKAAYEKFGIKAEPVVFVKNDAGTYGMAIMSVRSGDEIRSMNRKTRNKMSVGKGSTTVHDVIIQEGVVTTDRLKGFVAEPVVYLVGNEAPGGFYRLNEEKGDMENLNSQGMKFSKLCFNEDLGYENIYDKNLDAEALYEIYKIIAQIASIAAGHEIINLKS